MNNHKTQSEHMKTSIILLLSIITLFFSCEGSRSGNLSKMVTPVGQNIAVRANNKFALPLAKGDTVIISMSIGTSEKGYVIENDFLLHESWVKNSPTLGLMGKYYYRAIVK